MARGLPGAGTRRVNARGVERPDNTGKKAGNLANFCERWGRRYDFMVVLDADSLMAGGTLVKMARLMELNPRVGSWTAATSRRWCQGNLQHLRLVLAGCTR